MSARLISYIKFLFKLAQLEAAVVVNKLEAKCS